MLIFITSDPGQEKNPKTEIYELTGHVRNHSHTVPHESSGPHNYSEMPSG